MMVLGIETSCDDTGVALVDSSGQVLAEALQSQGEAHRPFGGVVPEIAARAHIAVLDRLINQVMRAAGVDFADLSGVAAAAGPGLIGGLITGLVTAKAIAAVQKKPLIAVNHLEAHALTVRLTAGVAFPYLLLLVSGGHCQLLVVEGVGRYRRLGTTLDDALGEAFDKAAKMLGFGYPGGPLIERAALEGDPARFGLPRPLAGEPGCHFSFSGLKTALRQTIERQGAAAFQSPMRNDLAASFQEAAFDALLDRTARGIAWFKRHCTPAATLVVAGGVAANSRLRHRLKSLADSHDLTLEVPPPRLCTDNGVMIAWAGLERLAAGLIDPLSVSARARWPLDPHAEPVLGAGVKG